MTNGDIARAIRAEINQVEASLARIDALATDEFRNSLGRDELATASAALIRANKAVADLHRAGLAAMKSSGDVTIQSGGGGGK